MPEDSDPNADYTQELNTQTDREVNTQTDRDMTSWASEHRSFPEVSADPSKVPLCFFQTESGQHFNLEAICGSSVKPDPHESQAQPPSHQH